MARPWSLLCPGPRSGLVRQDVGQIETAVVAIVNHDGIAEKQLAIDGSPG
jgi:hypothetical protein